MNQEKIGRFIAQLRKEKSLTQEEFGNRIGVSGKTISRWENGNYMPDISLLEIIAKELNITISELLKGEKIEEENLINETNKDIINLLKSKNKEKKKYVKHLIISVVIVLFVIAFSIVQMIRLKNLDEEPDAIKLENDVYISNEGAKINYNELLILQQIYDLKKVDIESITEEEVKTLLNSYYANLQTINWYGLINLIGGTKEEKVNVMDADVSVVEIKQKGLPFTSIMIDLDDPEYYCLLGFSKYSAFILSEYKDNKCIITEKECERLKEEGVTTKLNLDYCN